MVLKPIEIDGKQFIGTAISMGNPHFVIFVDDINSTPISIYGPKLECHPYFPNRVNVEFAQMLSDGKIRMRVWERGSGITMACGTGACATAVAAAVTGKSGRKSDIVMDGGTLTIEWDEDIETCVYDGTCYESIRRNNRNRRNLKQQQLKLKTIWH
jgi:diaminopimelate epimerase